MKKALVSGMITVAAVSAAAGILGTGMLISAIIRGDVDTVTLEPISVQEQIRNEQLIQGFGGY